MPRRNRARFDVKQLVFPWMIAILAGLRKRQKPKKIKKAGLSADGRSLDYRAARLVKKRLEGCEDWLRSTDLQEWQRIVAAVCPEMEKVPQHEQAILDGEEPVCEMPNGDVIPIRALPDGYAIAPRQGDNGKKGPATRDGEFLPPPKAVRIQGAGAATRGEVLRAAGREDDGGHYHNGAPEGHKEGDAPGRAARVACAGR